MHRHRIRTCSKTVFNWLAFGCRNTTSDYKCVIHAVDTRYPRGCTFKYQQRTDWRHATSSIWHEAVGAGEDTAVRLMFYPHGKS